MTNLVLTAIVSVMTNSYWAATAPCGFDRTVDPSVPLVEPCGFCKEDASEWDAEHGEVFVPPVGSYCTCWPDASETVPSQTGPLVW